MNELETVLQKIRELTEKKEQVVFDFTNKIEEINIAITAHKKEAKKLIQKMGA